MSYTFTLSGRETILSSKIYPPIVLSDNEEYALGLINFESYNSIPNVDKTNNRFHYRKNSEIIIPEGSYEIQDINQFIKNYFQLNSYTLKKPKKNVSEQETLIPDKEEPFVVIEANNNTLQCEIKANVKIDFTKENSIGKLLGFNKKVLEANKRYVSENPIDIFKVNSICIECNLVTNSYNNGKLVHIIHMFYPTSPPGHKIVEKPTNVIYLPISMRYINEITLKITDQDGNLINFRNELITIRLHLKKL